MRSPAESLQRASTTCIAISLLSWPSGLVVKSLCNMKYPDSIAHFTEALHNIFTVVKWPRRLVLQGQWMRSPSSSSSIQVTCRRMCSLQTIFQLLSARSPFPVKRCSSSITRLTRLGPSVAMYLMVVWLQCHSSWNESGLLQGMRSSLTTPAKSSQPAAGLKHAVARCICQLGSQHTPASPLIVPHARCSHC